MKPYYVVQKRFKYPPYSGWIMYEECRTYQRAVDDIVDAKNRDSKRQDGIVYLYRIIKRTDEVVRAKKGHTK